MNTGLCVASLMTLVMGSTAWPAWAGPAADQAEAALIVRVSVAADQPQTVVGLDIHQRLISVPLQSDERNALRFRDALAIYAHQRPGAMVILSADGATPWWAVQDALIESVRAGIGSIGFAPDGESLAKWKVPIIPNGHLQDLALQPAQLEIRIESGGDVERARMGSALFSTPAELGAAVGEKLAVFKRLGESCLVILTPSVNLPFTRVVAWRQACAAAGAENPAFGETEGTRQMPKVPLKGYVPNPQPSPQVAVPFPHSDPPLGGIPHPGRSGADDPAQDKFPDGGVPDDKRPPSVDPAATAGGGIGGPPLGRVPEKQGALAPFGRPPGEADSSPVVFLCSAGGSMLIHFDSARIELEKSVDRLRVLQQFNIIFYHDGKAVALSPDRPLQATADNKKRAKAFIENMSPKAVSDPLPGFAVAFTQRPKLIYWLAAQDPGNDTEVAAELAKQTKDHPTRINTISFTTDKEGNRLLRKVAEDNGGVFKTITDE